MLIQFKEFYREPGALFWSFAFPVLMSLGLGVAFSSKKEIQRTVAITECHQKQSCKLDSFLQTDTKLIKPTRDGHPRYEKTIENKQLGNTTYHFIVTSWNDAMVHLKRGNISLIMTDEGDSVKYHFDPINPDAQLSYLHISSMIKHQKVFEQSENIVALDKAGTRYIDFLIPGLIAMGIMSSCLWGISYGLIEKRAKKLLRRMIATPMKKSFFLISQLVTRLVFTFLETVILVLFAWLVFDVTIQGSLIALFLVFLSGNLVFIGIGILISSRTSKTEIGNGLISAVTMPMMVLSGIFFSYYNFPDWSITVIQKLPLTVFADSIRSIFVEGAGIVQVLPGVLILTLTGFVFFVVGLKIYKWH